MLVGVVDYHAGNLTSVKSALSFLNVDFVVSTEPDGLKGCGKLIFPGVGEAGSAMQVLRGAGWDHFLSDWVKSGKEMLGICLGHQIIFGQSEESNTACLGLIPGEVKRFAGGTGLKVPQIGWNTVEREGESPLFRDIPSDAGFYFVHSYYAVPDDPGMIIGTTDYICRFASAVQRDSLFSVQFHPEKSGRYGLRLLDNFLKM
ncbi:MAG: imidazole glycerol phosphate synthase subunit HisH [Spirochaetia bacterium]|nr:imidazole glycerol phosphate synthase subunit HisH [Spirochaetia bacterium]